MPFIIAHGLFATIVYWIREKKLEFRHWKHLLFYIFCSFSPDLDFIPGLFVGQTNRFHHGLSHSLFGAIFIAGFLFLFYKLWQKKGSWKEYFFILFLVSSHGFMDLLSVDTSFPYGCPIFFNYIISPWVFFQDIHRSGIEQIFSLHNLRAIGIEIGTFFPFVVALLLTQHYQNKWNKTKFLFLWMFALGLSLATIYGSMQKTHIIENQIIFCSANFMPFGQLHQPHAFD